nr:MAG TPA: hypothetical protein [Bacteriophage sp.]
MWTSLAMLDVDFCVVMYYNVINKKERSYL